MYFISFDAILAREPIGSAIEIVDASDLEAFLPKEEQINEIIDDGQVVQVEKEFGVAFHHPKKAFEYIKSTNYMKYVHVSFPYKQ